MYTSEKEEAPTWERAFSFVFSPEARSHPQSGKAGKERSKELRKSKERGKDGYANVAEDRTREREHPENLFILIFKTNI